MYRQELRLWMNLYLPSVKLVKKVRVGSKLRRVYSPAQTPFERVLASGRADARHMAKLKKLCSTLDPFELAQTIDRKLDKIYALANRRLSPKPENSRATAVEKPRRGKVQKTDFPTALGNPAKGAGFPTAITAGVRLHLLCLDSRAQSYISKWLDTSGSNQGLCGPGCIRPGLARSAMDAACDVRGFSADLRRRARPFASIRARDGRMRPPLHMPNSGTVSRISWRR